MTQYNCLYTSALKHVCLRNQASSSVHGCQKKTHLRRVATSFNSVLRTTAALCPPVEMKLLQSVGVFEGAPLDHCSEWGGGNILKILIFTCC